MDPASAKDPLQQWNLLSTSTNSPPRKRATKPQAITPLWSEKQSKSRRMNILSIFWVAILLSSWMFSAHLENPNGSPSWTSSGSLSIILYIACQQLPIFSHAGSMTWTLLPHTSFPEWESLVMFGSQSFCSCSLVENLCCILFLSLLMLLIAYNAISLINSAAHSMLHDNLSSWVWNSCLTMFVGWILHIKDSSDGNISQNLRLI